MAWYSFFTFKLGDHITPDPNRHMGFTAGHSKSLSEIQKLQNQITALDKASFYTKLGSAFFLTVLNTTKQLVNSSETLNMAIDYLNIIIPLVTGAAVTVLEKNNADLVLEIKASRIAREPHSHHQTPHKEEQHQPTASPV